MLTLYKWWDIQCIGVTPVRTFTFIAILFTSGLDVGLIMFPLTEFAAIALYFSCLVFIVAKKRAEVAAIKASPEENILDFEKIEVAG